MLGRINKRCIKCSIVFNATPEILKGEFVNNSEGKKGICRYCLTWDMIFDIYKQAYKDDPNMLTILSSSERVIYKLNPQKIDPDPIRFRKILQDRGAIIDNKVKNVWNIARDESCRYLRYHRWEDNEKLNVTNKILNVLGNFRL